MLSSSQWVVAMPHTVDPHIDEETTEKYSRGDLAAAEVARVEEHFLICESCRNSLQGIDTYLAAMRQAASILRRAEKKPKLKVARRAGVRR
jgi:predicted anti-sigma-YlaC factor YlaD